MLKKPTSPIVGTYDAPRMELIRFTAEDVITTSGTNSEKVGTYESGGDTRFDDIFTT